MKRALPLLLLVPLAVGVLVVVSQLGHWLASPDPVRRVDVIVVTSGAPDQRVPAAVRHLRAGNGPVVWVLDKDGEVLRTRDQITRYASEHGADGRVRFVGRSESVLGDARAVRAYVIAQRLDVRRIGVITAPWQVARVRVAFERTLGARVSVWTDGSRYDADGWWRHRRAVTVQEAAKTAATLAVLGPQPANETSRPPASLALRALLGGFVGAAVAGALCRPLARRLRLVSVPRLWRSHSEPTPMLGGVALLVGLVCGAIAGGGIRLGPAGAVAAAGIGALALVGLVDDLSHLGQWTRLAWAGGAGLLAWLLGLRVAAFRDGEIATVGNALLTVLWFVGVTYAVGILDHVDGATAGVGLVSAATIAVIGAMSGQFVVAVAAAALAGACLGFLVHNFPPARLFMGDMGALAIGFALAALALALTPRQAPPLSLFVPVLALGVPIFDTTLVTISRMRAGLTPGTGGTDHTSHRLLARGYSARSTFAVLVGAQVIGGGLAVAVAQSQRGLAYAVVVLAAAVGGGALIVFLRLPIYRPAAHTGFTGEVTPVLDSALDALRSFDEAASRTGLSSTDPAAIRSIREGARRLEAIRSRLGDR